MAIVDVDRHILSEIANYSTKQKKLYEEFSIQWEELLEALDSADTLYWRSESEVREHDGAEMRTLADRVWKARRKLSRLIIAISLSTAKQDALLLHLVSKVQEVDTQKGLETK